MASIRKRVLQDSERTVWLVDYRDQEGHRRFKQFDRRKDADAWLVQARGQVAAGTHTPDATSSTLADALAAWLERARAEGLERATLAQYDVHGRHLLGVIDGRTKLSKITHARCEQVRDALLVTLPRLTAAKVLASFKAILKDARRRGLVAQNAAADTRIATRDRHQRRLEVGVDVPTPLEIKRLIETAGSKARGMISLMALAGLRASEVRGLRWSDLVLGPKPSVTITQRADFAGTIGSPKSATGRRTIPLAMLAAAAVREWKLAQPPGRSLVFSTATDRPDSLPNIRRRVLFPAQIVAGVLSPDGQPKYSAHAFRHYAVSSWLASGIDLKTAQYWAGHATLALTLDTYGHMIPRADDHDRIAAVERLLGVSL